MSARDDILANVRRSLGASAQDAPRLAAANARIAAAAPGVRPLRGQGDQAQRVATFIVQAQSVQTTIERVGALDEAPAAVAAFLRVCAWARMRASLICHGAKRALRRWKALQPATISMRSVSPTRA